jgi:MoaA/NifB/PqqE/SkfB family radical SAM enzyme
LKRIVDVLTANGICFASFGGGEPLLFPHLFELARYAVDQGLQVSMNTNGYLLDEETALAIKQAGFTSVGLSIDGHEAVLHDAFRERPGSFLRAVRALDLLRGAGVKTTMSTVISRLNHHNLEDLVGLAVGHGVAQLFLHNFKCAGKGLANRAELDLSATEWRGFYQNALRLQEAHPELPVSLMIR